jgi:diguanylate cyclase (GGDEF)-like protein
MELKRYLMILWNWWWLALVVLITVVISTIAFTYTRLPRYETSVRLVVSPSPITATDLRELRETITGLDKPIVANTYAEIGQSPSTIKAAWSQLGLSPLQNYEVRASVLQETSIVIVTISGSNPVLVQRLADAVTDQTLAHVAELYEVYDLTLLDPASVPIIPTSPNTRLNLALGVLLGLTSGVLSAFLAEYLKTPVERMEQLSIVDTNTGAYKASYFLRRLRGEMSRSKRVRRPFVVGVVYLENFEEMTDSFAPETRQMVLKQVVQLFKQVLSEENLVARWRGNSLALLMPDFDVQTVQDMLKKVQTRLNWTTFEVGDTGFKLNLTSKFGLANYNLNGVSPEGLLDEAEQTLREAES